jgi:hypothetical protein
VNGVKRLKLLLLKMGLHPVGHEFLRIANYTEVSVELSEGVTLRFHRLDGGKWTAGRATGGYR